MVVAMAIVDECGSGGCGDDGDERCWRWMRC